MPDPRTRPALRQLADLASRETCVAALRAVFARAIDAGLVTANPAAALVKPRRAPSRRPALTDVELTDLIDAVRTTSNDPDLDLLLVQFHLESGARREGALPPPVSPCPPDDCDSCFHRRKPRSAVAWRSCQHDPNLRRWNSSASPWSS